VTGRRRPDDRNIDAHDCIKDVAAFSLMYCDAVVRSVGSIRPTGAIAARAGTGASDSGPPFAGEMWWDERGVEGLSGVSGKAGGSNGGRGNGLVGRCALDNQ
jgi:hypothetical protein